MDTFSARPYRLINQIQHYAWGTRGEDAFIPRLIGEKPEPGKAYAELWIGAHPKAPSQAVMDDGSQHSLIELVARFPERVLGERVSAAFGGVFPFLLKVLSVGEALSIQAHPNQEQASRLHRLNPSLYPDENHKPEIAIALDSLDALVGFKSLGDLSTVLQRYPELAAFVGSEIEDHLALAGVLSVEEQQAGLKAFYSALMLGSLERRKELEEALVRLHSRLSAAGSPTAEEALFLELSLKYPGDVGLASIFLLKSFHLDAGQAVFTGAGIPHAYLRGNLVECMAASDNVVRAGLTPKHKDIRTLVEMLDYQTAPHIFLPSRPAQGEVVYPAPAAEFRLTQLALPAGQEWNLLTQTGPEVLLVTRGSVQVHWASGWETCRQGEAFLIPAALGSYRLKAAGKAQVFRVVVPPAPNSGYFSR